MTGGGDPGYGGGDDDGGDDDGGKERGDNVWRWRAAAMLATTVATATMAEMASDGEGNGGAADPLTLVEAAADSDEFTPELTPGAARGGLASGKNRGEARKRGGRQQEDQAWRRREGRR